MANDTISSPTLTFQPACFHLVLFWLIPEIWDLLSVFISMKGIVCIFICGKNESAWLKSYAVPTNRGSFQHIQVSKFIFHILIKTYLSLLKPASVPGWAFRGGCCVLKPLWGSVMTDVYIPCSSIWSPSAGMPHLTPVTCMCWIYLAGCRWASLVLMILW